MSLAKGSFRLRVKSLAEPLASGSICLGIRLKKDAVTLVSWHDFSWQDLCHDGQLLSDFWFKIEVLLPCSTRSSISQN
jgi:hypothetical protein